MLSKKENALRLIKFRNPEYVITKLPDYVLRYLGCNHEGYDGINEGEYGLGSMWQDIWGTGWHKEQKGAMGLTYHYPLSEIHSLGSYGWPNPDDERICSKIYEGFAKYEKGDCFLAGSHRDTLWEKAYMLIGMENLMIYFYEEPGFVREILHKIMDFQIGIARHYLKVGIEIAYLGDDLGTQQSRFFSEEILHEFFIPEYKRIFDLYRQEGVLIAFHSCGKVEDLLETFIHLGVDILNPVQATANDHHKVVSAVNKRMAIQGGINSAIVMDGPVERIEQEVMKKIRLLGKYGGYICQPDQYMDYPPENLMALENAVKKHGRYPL